mmetsp:Transcript_12110/g.21628  ORF Transcript_12110/g.21628 Transcript_12110/m.21628 type:complete len:222 (-) Transcript_12110:556-1221(-)
MQYSSASAATRLPEASEAWTRPPTTSTFSTVSPRRKRAPRSRIWYMSESTISPSTNPRTLVLGSTMVTTVPGTTLIMLAYSMPMTPAPTTIRSRGTSRTPPHRIWSDSNTRFPSKGTCAGRMGRVPQATRKRSALSTVLTWSASRCRAREVSASASSPVRMTATRSGRRPGSGLGRKRAVPVTSSTPLRWTWSRMMSVSSASTRFTRARMSGTRIRLRQGW